MEASSRRSRRRPPGAPSGTGLGSPARARRENNTGPILIPSLDDVSIASITRAELEAWATLTRSCSKNDKTGRNPRSSFSKWSPKTLGRAVPATRSSSAAHLVGGTRSAEQPGYNGKSAVHRGRARPSSAKVARRADALFDELERFGPADTTTSADRPAVAGLGRTVHASRAGAKKRPASAGAISFLLVSREINACRAALADNPSSCRKQSEQHRSSEVSVRHVEHVVVAIPHVVSCSMEVFETTA